MKKFVYLFLIMFTSVLFLSSCRKADTTNNDITNDDEKIYQVSKEKFEAANDFVGINYLKYTINEWVVEAGTEKERKTNSYEHNSNESILADSDLMYFFSVIDNSYHWFTYDKESHSYKGSVTLRINSINTTIDFVLKYENDRIINFYAEETYENNPSEIFYSEISFEYNKK